MFPTRYLVRVAAPELVNRSISYEFNLITLQASSSNNDAPQQWTQQLPIAEEVPWWLVPHV